MQTLCTIRADKTWLSLKINQVLHHQWQPHSKYLSHNYTPPVNQSAFYLLLMTPSINIVPRVPCTISSEVTSSIYIAIFIVSYYKMFWLYFFFVLKAWHHTFLFIREYFAKSTILLPLYSFSFSFFSFLTFFWINWINLVFNDVATDYFFLKI